MKTKNSTLMFIALFAALVTFACGGGAAVTATSVPAEITPAVESTEPVNEIEGELEITSASSYVDNFNDYNVSGEIRNNTNQTLEDITLSLSITDESGVSLLKDDNGNPVNSIEIQPHISALVSGSVSSFNYYISADDVKPANFEVSIKSYEASSAPDLADVTVQNVQSVETEDGDVLITGEVINKSSDYVDVEALAGAMLDKDLDVLAAGSTLTYARYLYPAGDANGRDHGPFIVRLYGPITNAEHWKMYGRGVATDDPPSTDMDVQYSRSYVDTYGTYHLLGTVTNNSSSQVSPSVLSGLSYPDKTVFDAASANIPLYLNTGESAPFDITAFQAVTYLSADRADAAEKVIQPDLYWTFETDYELVSLETKDVEVTQDGYDWIVSGTAVNTSDTKLSSISAVVQFLDENRQVLATNSVSMYPPEGSDTIDPGTSNEFSVSIYAPEDWDLSSQDYQIILQGIVSE